MPLLCFANPRFGLNMNSVPWDLTEEWAASAISHLRRGFFFLSFFCDTQLQLPPKALHVWLCSSFHNQQSNIPNPLLIFFQIFPYFNHFNQSDHCLSLQTLVEQPGQLFLRKCNWSPGDSLFSPLFAAASSSIGFLLKTNAMLDLPQEVFRRRQNTVVSESGAKMERGLLSVVWEGLLPFVTSRSKSFKISYHIHKRQITCVISSVFFWVVLTIDPNFLQLFSFLHFFFHVNPSMHQRQHWDKQWMRRFPWM